MSLIQDRQKMLERLSDRWMRLLALGDPEAILEEFKGRAAQLDAMRQRLIAEAKALDVGSDGVTHVVDSLQRASRRCEQVMEDIATSGELLAAGKREWDDYEERRMRAMRDQ